MASVPPSEDREAPLLGSRDPGPGESPATPTESPPADAAAGGGEKRFLQDSLVLYAAMYLGLAFHFVAGFLVASILGPARYGLRAIFGLVEQYESVLTLGTYNAMERQVPYHRGKREAEEARRVSACVLVANVSYAGIGAILLVGASIPVRTLVSDPIYADFLLFLAAYILITRLERFFHADLIIRKMSGAVGGLRLVEGSVTAVATVALTYHFELRGLFVGILLGKGLGLIYAAWRSRGFPGLEFSWSLFRTLVAIGFPIMLARFLFILFQSVDKVLVASLLNTELLGYFAVAAILSGVVFGTLGDMARVMFAPRMMEKLGSAGDRRVLKDYLIEPTTVIAWLVPPVLGVLYLGVHLPFEHFMTEYLPTIPVAKILLLGQHFFAVATMSILTCIALGRQMTLVWLTLGGAALNAVVNTVVIQLGWGITGVAVGTGISYFVYAAAISVFSLALFGPLMRAEVLRLIRTLLLPWVIAVALLVIVDRTFPVGGLGFWEDVGLSTLRIAMFLALFGLAMWPMRRDPALARLGRALSGLSRRVSAPPRG